MTSSALVENIGTHGCHPTILVDDVMAEFFTKDAARNLVIMLPFRFTVWWEHILTIDVF